MQAIQTMQSPNASHELAHINSTSLQYAVSNADQASESVEAARSRKSHKKSRFGCLCCKRRRVKCDETRPTCSACQKRKLKCSFSIGDQNETSTSEPVRFVAGYRSVFPSKPRKLDSTEIECSMIESQLSSKIDSRKSSQVRFDVNDLKFLECFAQITGPTIGDVPVQAVYSTIVPRLAIDHPHLMHAILAISFLHTKYLSSSYPTSTVSSRYARYHWQQCLSLYNTKVAPRITGSEADAMLITSTLINGLAFALVNDTCHESAWPFSDRTDDLSWLGVQSGITLIFRATFPLELSSKIKEIFKNMENKSYLISNLTELLDAAPDLCQICNITETSTSFNNPYFDQVKLLASLTRIPCTPKTVFIHLSFIGSAHPRFITLLRRKDHIALLILSYWYANMCVYDCWWISIRSRTECAAICLYLEQYASDAIISLLDPPARACGVLLKRQRELRGYSRELEPQTLMPCAPM